jgi:hypothetical protein
MVVVPEEEEEEEDWSNMTSTSRQYLVKIDSVKTHTYKML